MTLLEMAYEYTKDIDAIYIRLQEVQAEIDACTSDNKDDIATLKWRYETLYRMYRDMNQSRNECLKYYGYVWDGNKHELCKAAETTKSKRGLSKVVYTKRGNKYFKLRKDEDSLRTGNSDPVHTETARSIVSLLTK